MTRQQILVSLVMVAFAVAICPTNSYAWSPFKKKVVEEELPMISDAEIEARKATIRDRATARLAAASSAAASTSSVRTPARPAEELPEYSLEDYEYVGMAVSKYGYDWKGTTGELPPDDFECPEERPIPAVLGDPTSNSDQQYLDFVRGVLALMEDRNQVAMIGDITPTMGAVYIACVNWEDVVPTYGTLEQDFEEIRKDIRQLKRDVRTAQSTADGVKRDLGSHEDNHPTFDLTVGPTGGFTSSPEYLEPMIGGSVALRLGHPIIGVSGTLVFGATPAGFHPGTDDADILLGVSGAVSLRFMPDRFVGFGLGLGAGFEEFVATPGYDTARSIHGILTPELRIGKRSGVASFVATVPIKLGGSYLGDSPTQATSPMIGVGVTLGARFYVF